MIDFPPLPGGAVPRWIGPGFEVEGQRTGVLEYSFNVAGWDDALTAMHEAEAGSGNHPIDVESRKKAVEALKRGGFPRGGALLEVGCSSGFLISQLCAEYPQATLVGADVVSAPLVRLAETHPKIAFVRMSLTECVFPANSFDAVVALNVLEHIEEHDRAAAEIHRVLKPGGIFVIEVPQGPGLFDSYDRALRHFRRYSGASLRTLLVNAGFRILYQSYLGCLIYPAFALAKLIGRTSVRGQSEDMRRTERQMRYSRGSRVLAIALKCDGFLERFARLPIGIRCVAIGRKLPQG
jgi:ubiquinone/menaquinone biosynthesis C-methylase UbiE